MGKRGEVNDADGIRLGKPEYLVKALDKALKCLRKRAAKLPAQDVMKMWIEHSIGDLGVVSLSINDRKAEISGISCLQAWSLSATSLSLIDGYLTAQGL